MSLYRHDRAGRPGGGICLYARSDFVVTELSKSDRADRDNPEYVIYRIHTPTFSTLLAIVYRPPETNLPTKFLDSLSQFIPLYSHVIVTGDFNIDMMSSSDNATYFRRHFSNKSLHLVDSPPTHHTLWRDGTAHHTWLDLFFLKDPHRLAKYRKSDEPFTVGHDFTEIDYSLLTPPPAPLRITSRNLKHLNSSSVAPHLADNLNAISPSLDSADARLFTANLRSGLPTTPVDFFATAISNAVKLTFDTLAPPITFTTSPRKKPWVSADIRQMISMRRRLYRIACRSPSEQAVAEYRRVRNHVCSLISTAKNKFIALRIDKAPSVGEKWRELHKLGLGSAKTNSPFKHFTPEVLNSHFASVCSSSPPLAEIDVVHACGTPTREGLAEFNFSPATDDDVREALSACVSTSVGVDGISAEMLRLSSPGVVRHITSLINESLVSGSFPADWKRAVIVPLLKTTSPSSPSDTRPIALLSCISKVAERVVHKQLVSHLTAHKLLDPRQSGYRQCHSTQTALLGILDDVRDNIEGKQLNGLLAFDFSKAFDTIPHARLLVKLRQVGCAEPVVKWFGSYLSGRTQAVKDADGKLSSWQQLHTGVPQGSVLGPLLFSIFLLDLPSVLRHSRHMLYADDLHIYATGTPTSTGLAALSGKLTQDATAVIKYASDNGLTANPKKTSALLLGSAAYLSLPEVAAAPPVTVDGSPVPYSRQLTSLGVIITPTLNWEEHINRLSARVFYSLHSLRFYKHALVRSLRKRLVESLIFPHFDYCCAVYHHLTVKQNERLHRLLNACVRFIYGNIPWNARVTPYRLALGWLSVSRRREYLIGSLAYKVSTFGEPSHLLEGLVPVHTRAEIRRSQRTASGYFLSSHARTEALRNSFSHTAVRIVNSLGCAVSSDLTPSEFQSRLWNHLFSLDRSEWAELARRDGLAVLPAQLGEGLARDPPRARL